MNDKFKKDFPETYKVIEEMCKRVGTNAEEIDFSTGPWFLEKERTKDEEYQFVKWLIKELENDKLKREMTDFPKLFKTERMRTKLANEFIFTYGWQLKDE